MDKKQRLFFAVTWFLLLLLILFSLFIYIADDKQGQRGAVGPKGKDAVVDYQKIEAYVDQKFELLPVPKDGRDGRDGKDGKDGHTPVKGVDYFDGKDGANGINGADPQMYCNYEIGHLEWKLSTEDLWTILPVRCGQ